MSSDREKVECFNVLGEVFQYVLQDKRNAAKVAKHLQQVIGPLGKLLFAEGNDFDFVEAIKEKTISGKITWHLEKARHKHHDWVREDVLSSTLDDRLQYLIDKPQRGAWQNGFLRIYDIRDCSHPAYVIVLSKEHKEFFNKIFDLLKVD